jgi:diguanylate cyclase (GGDEF)-like protein/PAS domain S-box-containing protein
MPTDPQAPVAPLPPPPAGAPRATDLADAALVGLLVVQDGRIRYANAALSTMLGAPAGDMLGQPFDVITAPEFRARARLAIERRLAGHSGRPGDLRGLRHDGSTFDARVYASRIHFEGRPAVLVNLFDVSELVTAQRHVAWNAGMLARTEALCRSGSFEIAWPVGTVTPSSGLRELVGQTDADGEGEGDAADGAGFGEAGDGSLNLDTLSWIPPEERAYVAGIWRNAAADEPFEFQHRVQCADGRRLVVLHRGMLTLDGQGGGRGVAILQDITAQREAEQRIADLASHDEVTGLPNRAALLDGLDAAMHAARWSAREIALLTLDVPRIAEIKSSMGFGAGDTLAMALASRLHEAIEPGEAIAQLGDTEFALTRERDAGADAIALEERARTLLGVLQAPVRLGSTDAFPLVRIGVASFPADADSPGTLLEAAQTARLDIGGASGVARFRQAVAIRARREMQIESALRHAIEADELELHYQPQVDLAGGGIRGAEALLRWRSAELGPVSPAEFIPIAERSGLIGAIGDWVLERACQQIAAWQRAHLPALRVSVNLSPAQLQRPDLARHVQAVLIRTGARAECLGLELTESMLMADIDSASAALRAIKSLGVEIALDDFGTGYSNLNNLSRLPIDVVKVDRSFVHDVTAATQQVSVTRAIINMAHSLQMQVLAEGVETEGQLTLLASNGCDQIQGYWFSKPVPAADFEALVREGKRLPERFVLRRPRQRTLLLVDDEENILASLKRLLRRDGYHIVTANSAAEGLQRLAEHEVDVIVSDQRMPGMTGVEFLHRAKALYPATVRLVLSGYTELQSIIDAVNEGAIYKFLTKPWDDQRLRAHIAEAFRQKELADENQRLNQQVETANADLAALNERLSRLLLLQREQADLLAASTDSLRDVLDELPVGVLGIDPEGLVAYTNRAAEQSLPAGDLLLGRPAHEVLPAAWLHQGPEASQLAGTPTGAAHAAHAAPARPAIDPTTDFQVLAGPLGSGDAHRGQLLILLPPALPEAA